MTSDVLANKLSAMDIEYLKQRTEKDVVIDDMTSDKIIFQKEHLNNLTYIIRLKSVEYAMECLDFIAIPFECRNIENSEPSVYIY